MRLFNQRLVCCLLLAAASSSGQEPARPRLAVVIDDFGFGYARDVPDESWMRLPQRLTFAVMPKSPRTRLAAERTLESGKELLIHFPFDPFLKLDLQEGPEPSDGDKARVSALLEDALKSIPGAAGLNNHRSYRATQDAALMRWFMGELKAREPGLYFLDSRVSTRSVAYAEARKASIRAAVNGIFLDGNQEPEGRRSRDPAVLEAAREKDKRICLQALRQAARAARRDGAAVAIGHHYFHGTYRCLKEGLPALEKEGIELVFASKVAR